MKIRTEAPYMGSRFAHSVTLVDTPEGEIRIEFTQATTRIFANVEVFEDGRIEFVFESPVNYSYLRVYETTGKTETLSGKIKSISATTSQLNLLGFKELYLGFPITGYIFEEKYSDAVKIAETFKNQKPKDLRDFPGKESVPGFVINGRPGLSKFLNKDLPRILYPEAIPLTVLVDPFKAKILEGSAKIIGSPNFRTIGAIEGETVGLDNNGTLAFGGPDGFAEFSQLRQIDLQDGFAADFVKGRAEVLRMQREIQNEFKRRHNMPTFTTGTVEGKKVIRMIRGGRGDPGAYDSFQRISTCVSILTGRAFQESD